LESDALRFECSIYDTLSAHDVSITDLDYFFGLASALALTPLVVTSGPPTLHFMDDLRLAMVALGHFEKFVRIVFDLQIDLR
jgi:hypothetical protein